MLVSSRDEVDIRQAISDADSLDVADTVADDIDLFVRNPVSQMIANAPRKSQHKTCIDLDSANE